MNTNTQSQVSPSDNEDLPVTSFRDIVTIASRPVEQTMRLGLNLRVKCKNQGCSEINKNKWVPKNFGTFNWGAEFHSCICSNCKKPTTIERLAFNNCSYFVKMVTESTLIRDILIHGETPKSQFSYISSSPNSTWIETETSPIDQSNHHQPAGLYFVNPWKKIR
jgi:hypothetical protein